MPKLIGDLNVWQRSLLHKQYDNEKGNVFSFLYGEEGKEWTNGVYVGTYYFKSFDLTFGIGEKRVLFITYAHSCDYSEIYEGDKIIFSLGCWGMSEEIMMVVAESVKEFGDVYYVHNNCSEDFRKLDL